jgi:hypothetical protein
MIRRLLRFRRLLFKVGRDQWCFSLRVGFASASGRDLIRDRNLCNLRNLWIIHCLRLSAVENVSTLPHFRPTVIGIRGSFAPELGCEID